LKSSRVLNGWLGAGAAALAVLFSSAALGSETRASFAVTVNLKKAPETAACSTSTASVVCTGIAVPPVKSTQQQGIGQPVRFWITDGAYGPRYGAVDLYPGAGTITSWRVVRLASWDYLEMTIGW
jgi:hypothetical protein